MNDPMKPAPSSRDLQGMAREAESHARMFSHGSKWHKEHTAQAQALRARSAKLRAAEDKVLLAADAVALSNRR